MVENQCRSLQSIELTLRSMLEETTLSTPTHGHVLLLYRHTDAAHEANGNAHHVALGLYRNVPMSDLELLLPHIQVRMPELQRAQFGAMGVVGLFTASPLLQEGALTLTGLITLYAVGALAARTAVRWRSAKQLYHQLLLSYQNSNRVGSSDGALLCAAHLAEEEQTKQALLALHTLLRAQQRGHPSAGAAAERGGALSTGDLARRCRRTLHTWTELSGLQCHIDDEWRHGPLPDADGHRRAARRGPTGRRRSGRRYARRPAVDEALTAATSYWQRMGDASAYEEDHAFMRPLT